MAKRKRARRNFYFDLQDEKLTSTYIHSSVDTFYNLLSGPVAGGLLRDGAANLRDKMITRGLRHVQLLRKKEKEVIRELFPENIDRKDALELMNTSLFDYLAGGKSLLFNIRGLKEQFLSRKGARRKKEEAEEEEAIKEYIKQMNEIQASLKAIVDYKSKINTLLGKPKNLSKKAMDALKDSYGASFDKIDKIYTNYRDGFAQILDSRNKDPKYRSNLSKQREDLNKLFGEVVKRETHIYTGLINEPAVAEAFSNMKLDFKNTNSLKDLQVTVLGTEMQSKKEETGWNILDIEVILGTLEEAPVKFGINVKSQFKEYMLSRAEHLDSMEKELGVDDKTISRLKYLTRNFLVLFSDNPGRGVMKKEDLRLYWEEYIKLSGSLIFYERLTSMIDQLISLSELETSSESSLKERTLNILIYYHGGFLWTSDVLELILEETIQFEKKSRSTSTISKNVIGYSYIMRKFSHRTEAQELYKIKEKILGEHWSSKKTPFKYQYFLKDSDFENALSQFFKQDKDILPMSSIRYYINLSRAKEILKTGGF